MQENDVKAILSSKQTNLGVEKYVSIMQTVSKVDVSSDAAFQTVYRDFYQMRAFYPEAFASGYFHLLEQMKGNPNLEFNQVLPDVVAIQGSFEISFASKLLHTIAPQNPIWDSVVTTNHFCLKVPSAKTGRVTEGIRRYEQYKKLFYHFLKTEEGQHIVTLFDNQFPDSGISDVKKLDFVLWQDKQYTIDVLCD